MLRLTVEDKRVSSLICADWRIRQSHFFTLQIDSGFFAVIEIRLQGCPTLACNPPLPRRQNGLGSHVRPLGRIANSTLCVGTHAFTGREIRPEITSLNDASSRSKVCNSNPATALDTHGRIGLSIGRAGLSHVLLHAREVHALTLSDHPLIGLLLHERTCRIGAAGDFLNIVIQTALVVIRGSKESNRSQRRVIFFRGVALVDPATGAKTGLVGFDSSEYFLVGVISIRKRPAIHSLAVVSVVHEDRRVNTPVFLVAQPRGLRFVEGRVGVVPLSPQTLAGQIGHEGLEFLVVPPFFLVEEITVETVVLGHINQFLGDDIALGVRIFIEHLSEGQARTE